jgi:hypothetical protein
MDPDRWQAPRHLQVLNRCVLDLFDGQLGTDALLVKMPPRHGKSEFCSGWTPAWFLTRNPEKSVILTSNEHEFTCSWARKARMRYGDIGRFGVEWGFGRKNTQAEWETNKGGVCYAAGVGGNVTGRGSHLLICDDLVKNSEEAQSQAFRDKAWDWFRSTAYTRLEPGGKLIAIGTPWHRDDPIARIEQELNPYVIEFPAIAREQDILGRNPGDPLWPERFDSAALERRRLVLGPYWWGALYQLRPSSHEHAEWPDSYFEGIFCDAFPDVFECAVIAIDPASGTKKGCYCPDIFVGWNSNTFWVWADVARRPVEAAATCAANKALKYTTDLLYVEGNGMQYLSANEMRRELGRVGLATIPVACIPSKGKKEDRIRRLGPRLAQRQMRIWNNAGGRMLVDQLKDFPLGDFVDGPDCLEMAIRALNSVAREKASAVDSDRLEELEKRMTVAQGVW